MKPAMGVASAGQCVPPGIDPDELKTVCTATSGEMRLLFAVGIYIGLRLGDAATLRWGEVDLCRRIIRRIPAKTGRRNPKPVVIPSFQMDNARLLAILEGHA